MRVMRVMRVIKDDWRLIGGIASRGNNMNDRYYIPQQDTVSGPFPGLKAYGEMFKIHLCLYIGLSAVTGHMMAVPGFSFDALLSGFLVFILACGCAVLNNIQDMAYDTFFLRTFQRSLPQRKVPVSHAAYLALLFIAAGLSGLFILKGTPAFFWGVMAVGCYNGLYTPLKKRFLLAILPGSICGMLPPLIGWTGAGGAAWDHHILTIAMVFGLWQIPHFFIILLKERDRRLNTRGAKQIPCFTKVFSPSEIKLQVSLWTALYSLAILLFLMKGLIRTPFLYITTGLNAVVIISLVSFIVLKFQKQHIPVAFAAINLSMLFFMGAVICDSALF